MGVTLNTQMDCCDVALMYLLDELTKNTGATYLMRHTVDGRRWQVVKEDGIHAVIMTQFVSKQKLVSELARMVIKSRIK